MTKVTILGCGVVGAAIAYELSRQPDLQITVIDKQAPAQGSTGAALGVLMGVVSQRGWQLRQISIQRYETLIPELEEITGLTIPYNRHGIVLLTNLAAEMEKWAALAKVRKSQGWDLQLWQPETIKERCPQINLLGCPVMDRPHPSPLPEGERGQEKLVLSKISKIKGAVYSPCDRQVDPIALTHALIAAAQKNGVEFHFGVNVRLDTRVNNGVSIHASSTNPPATYSPETNHLEIGYLGQRLSPEQWDADWLILATGLGTTELTTSIGTPVDIRPVLGQAIQLEMPHTLGDPAFQPVISGHDIHIVPVANHHYWIGATVEFPEENGNLSSNSELLEIVRQGAINFCPALAEGKVVKTWSGLRPRPEAQPAPIIKKLPNQNRIILATGHYRNGVLLAPATAIAVREMLQT